ncbi:MAG: IS1634 family transposase [Methanomassiliicoccaceae archaeon]|nr:IS1634 family transposase [Methanomassiliicoccaceae archaeon]
MAYKVVQKIRGKYYLYEVTEAEWDPKKKNSKQKRRYIGPCDENGTIDDSRRKAAPAASAPAEQKLYWSKNIGQYGLLTGLASRSGLDADLAAAFGGETAKDILALAVMRIAQPGSLRGMEDSIESTYLRELLDIKKGYSSQRMTEIIRAIGEDIDAKKRYCAKAVKDSKAVIFDTTALFSSSKLYEMLEYGRKYKKTGLPQVNMGYVHCMDSGIPVYYKLYPGSITDVVTLVNLIKEMKAMGSSAEHTVLDRGFYSAGNIRAMYSEGYRFTMPLPSGNDLFKSLITDAIDELDNPENMFRFDGRTEFCVDLEIKMPFKDITDAAGNAVEKIRALVFQNNDRRKDEIDTLAARIDSVEADAAMTKWSKEKESELFRGRNAELKNFFDVSKAEDGKIALKGKRNAISFAMRNTGRMILLTTSEAPAAEILGTYHLRDSVEKDFETLKDDMEGGIEYVRDTVSAEGMIFVQFIATGLRVRMMDIVRKNPSLKRLGVPAVLRSLNLMTVSNVNGTVLMSEVTKKQREIFEQFGVDLPSVKQKPQQSSV